MSSLQYHVCNSHLPAQVFNVGQLRRSRARQRAQQYAFAPGHSANLLMSSERHRSGKREDHTASYFSHDNVEATRLRDQLANDSLEMLIQWLKEGGNVGIHGESYSRLYVHTTLNSVTDATNSTRSRRYMRSALTISRMLKEAAYAGRK